MDAGLIAVLKARYRASLLAQFLEILLKRQPLRECAKALPKGMTGIAKGHDVHVVDVAKHIEELLARFSYTSHQANVLYPPNSAELANTMDQVHIEDSNALDDF